MPKKHGGVGFARKLGIDLQKEVHEDMQANFAAYPNHWVLAKNDWIGVLTLRYLHVLSLLNVKF